MARPFTCGGANDVDVRDLARSVAWYVEKLGLREIEVEMDESEGCVALGFSNDEYIVAAKDFLNSRGAGLGEIEQGAQGTHYFEIRDPEGNVIEVSEEP